MSVPAVPTEAVKAPDLTPFAWAIVSSPHATPAARTQAAVVWWRSGGDPSPDAFRRAWFELRALARTITPAPAALRMIAGQPRSAPRRRGAGRPAGKRAAGRSGDSGDDDGPLDPSWPRRVAGHVALDLRAGRSHTVAVSSVRDGRHVCRALDRFAVAYALAMAIDGAGLAVTFTPERTAP